MKKNATRNALVMSIISMLLCVSMLVGTTFAWFTDEVVSGMNTIAAGNLDIEMYHTNAKVTNEKVQGATELFLDVNGDKILWEPGVVSYENIEIANVGSLALQYRLSLNIDNENYLNGHGLSEVLKVVFLDETIAAGATRAEVMALATAALEDPNYTLDGKLTHLFEQGKLYPADSIPAGEASSITGALVIFWAPNDNDVDNLYNANNGQVTSDGEPLHIDFGVKLEATQLMYENDSFDNTYDKLTGFQPIPVVDGAGTKINYTAGIGGAADSTILDTAYQFRPTESYEEGQLSQYFNYIVDFVVYADNYVPADSIMLAGYYDAWCQYNNDNWVGLIGGDIDAGTKIRLVKDGLGDAATVQYKHLLEYGNDGIGFLCGAKDLTGENAGTTITVELNLYETKLNDEGHYEETGVVINGGTFTYTFGGLGVASAEELKTALADGTTNVMLYNDLELDADETIAVAAGKELNLNLNGKTLSTVSDTTGANRNAIDVRGTVTVANGTITIEHTGDNMGWNNSTNVFNVTAGGVLNLKDATVENLGGSDMAFCVHLNNWGEVTLNAENTTFKSSYVAIRAFNSGNDMNNVTLTNCHVEGASNALWVHNYTEADFGGDAAKAAAHQALLNFTFNGTTFVGNPEKAGPIRYGFTNSIYANGII